MARARGQRPPTEFISGRVDKDIADLFWLESGKLGVKPGRALDQALRLWLARYGSRAASEEGRAPGDSLRPRGEEGIAALLEQCGYSPDRALLTARPWAASERLPYLLLVARATSGKLELQQWTPDEERMLAEMGYGTGAGTGPEVIPFPAPAPSTQRITPPVLPPIPIPPAGDEDW